MLLALDIGNTRIKAAVFEHNTLVEVVSFLEIDWQTAMLSFLNKYPKCTDLVVASVGNISKEQFSAFENRLKLHFISRSDRFPFHNLYGTPNTLGIDRMVLASGAVLKYPKQNRLVIDAGTCITYDFITDEDQYLGGGIAPGIRLRYEAMHQYTAKLPLLKKSVPQQFIGNTTEEAMHVGVVQGVLHEIDGFIDQYHQQYSKIIIILTGGDANFLANQLKNTIFANSNFLLESLNQTFQYKIKHD